MAASAESIEELYRSRYGAFRGGLTAITGSYDTARDVVQEAFAQALRDREQYRGEGSLAAWVWRIAFSVALRSRSRSRGSELTLDELVAAVRPCLRQSVILNSPRRCGGSLHSGG
jgi:DNA-directed RNA polymerase specialized sigma24 family protein